MGGLDTDMETQMGGVFGAEEEVQECVDGVTNTEVKRTECKALCSLETSRRELDLTWL